MNAESMKEAGSPTETRVGRSQRTYGAEERRRLLRLFERSGLSLKRFCQDQGIAVSTLSYWVRKSRRKSGRDGAGVMVEVPASVVSGKRARERVPSSVEIRLPNEVELKVSAGTDIAWIAELLRGLLTCSG